MNTKATQVIKSFATRLLRERRRELMDEFFNDVWLYSAFATIQRPYFARAMLWAYEWLADNYSGGDYESLHIVGLYRGDTGSIAGNLIYRDDHTLNGSQRGSVSWCDSGVSVYYLDNGLYLLHTYNPEDPEDEQYMVLVRI